MAHPRKITLPKSGPLVAWLVVVAIGSLTGAALWQAQSRAQSRPAPRFEGASIPVPPEQDRPWAAPATTLPTSLVTATRLLFEQGIADPRGCEYREVEISDRSLVSTHGFVLPAKPGEVRRFAVGWDGVVYPASLVGKAADLDADVRNLADSLRKSREEAVAKGTAGRQPRRVHGNDRPALSSGRGERLDRDPHGAESLHAPTARPR